MTISFHGARSLFGARTVARSIACDGIIGTSRSLIPSCRNVSIVGLRDISVVCSYCGFSINATVLIILYLILTDCKGVGERFVAKIVLVHGT